MDSYDQEIIYTDSHVALLQNHHWMSVPQFGGWDQEAPGSTDYSVVFAQARANRKQHKSNLNRASLGCEKELIAASADHHQKEDPTVVLPSH